MPDIDIELSKPYFLVVVDKAVIYAQFDSTLRVYSPYKKYTGRVLQVSRKGHDFLKNGDVVEFRMDSPIEIPHQRTTYYIIHENELLGKIESL